MIWLKADPEVEAGREVEKDGKVPQKVGTAVRAETRAGKGIGLQRIYSTKARTSQEKDLPMGKNALPGSKVPQRIRKENAASPGRETLGPLGEMLVARGRRKRERRGVDHQRRQEAVMSLESRACGTFIVL